MSSQGATDWFIAPMILEDVSKQEEVEQTETGPVCRKYVTENDDNYNDDGDDNNNDLIDSDVIFSLK